MAQRRFYTEVVIVTIMTWIVANAWTHLSNKVIREEFGDSSKVYFVVAIVFSIAAIMLLNYFFTEGEKNPKHILGAANFVKENGKDAEQEGNPNDFTNSTSCTCGNSCNCCDCNK